MKMRVRELAKIECIPASTIWAWIQAGKLECTRLGARVTVTSEQWETFKTQSEKGWYKKQYKPLKPKATSAF